MRGQSPLLWTCHNNDQQLGLEQQFWKDYGLASTNTTVMTHAAVAVSDRQDMLRKHTLAGPAASEAIVRRPSVCAAVPRVR